MTPRLLIVEDNASFAAAIENLLRDRGLTTERVGDGIAALKSILANPPDLILLDLNLPGLHGVELLRKLRAAPKTASLPVIVMSGVYKGERFVQATQELGVTDYLEKPFSAQRLYTAIANIPALQSTATTPSPAQTAPIAPPEPPQRPVAGCDRHLIQALVRRFSGELTLHDGELLHRLTFVNGAPVALRPGFIHRDFGDYLLKQGIINPAEYDYYANAGAYRHDLLVQMGVLHYHELIEHKFAFLTLELIAAIQRPPLAAELKSFSAPAGLQVISVNLPEIIHQGHRARFTPQMAASFGEQVRQRYAAPTPEYFHYINAMNLNEDERQLLSRLDGSRTVEVALQGEASLLPLLYSLQTIGMIRFSLEPLTAAAAPPWPLRSLFNTPSAADLPAEQEEMENFTDLLDRSGNVELPLADAPAVTEAPTAVGDRVRSTYAGLQGKDYYEIFGLTPGSFSFAKLKEGYFSITREFGPDLLMQLGGEEATQAESILSLVANAYETLSDVVKKEKYDQLLGSDKIGLGHRGDDRFRAQVQAQSGKVFIDMEEWDNAEKTLKDACAIEPDNGDTLAHLAWAIYRNPAYASSRPTLERARQMLNRAITMDRSAAAFAFKGWMLLDGNQESLAESEFNKALKLDARNLLARKGLRRIQEKREQEKKGIFGRMFGG